MGRLDNSDNVQSIRHGSTGEVKVESAIKHSGWFVSDMDGRN